MQSGGVVQGRAGDLATRVRGLGGAGETGAGGSDVGLAGTTRRGWAGAEDLGTGYAKIGKHISGGVGSDLGIGNDTKLQNK